MPYLLAPYEAATDPRTSTLVLVCGAQMGKTEFLLNLLAWNGHDRGRPALYIGPTEKNVRSVSNDRVRKLFRSTPALDALVAKGQADKVTEKWIRGARLGFAWASSATELATHPCAVVVVDERDRMASDVNSEGDPVILARARTKNYRNSICVVASTPTLTHASPVWTLWEEGTMGMWSWRCADCGAVYVPRLELLTYDAERSLAEIEATACIACPACGVLINAAPAQLNQTGVYQYFSEPGPEDPMKPTGPALEPRPSSTASFWISGLCSPWITFGEVARELEAAKRSGEPTKVQGVTNTWGGETFRMAGDRPAWQEIEACQAPYDAGKVPLGCQVLVAGVDVQRDRLYLCVRGFGHQLESWLLEETVLHGETAFEEVWIRLGNYLSRVYGDLSIARMLIDSGYKPAQDYRVPEHIVYQFCRRYPALAFPSKGYQTLARPYNLSELKSERLYLVTFDTDHFKTSLYHRVRWPQDEPGAWHVYRGISRDYCQQLVAEEVVQHPTGKRVWQANRRANHFFDCEVLNLVAARTLALEALPELAEVQAAGERQRAEPDPQPRRGSDFSFYD